MALIQCPECLLPVSSKGAACPRCAYPIEKLTNLFQASKQNDIEMVKDLLKSGADPNAVDNEGASPLMIASYYGHEDVAKLLLQAGANPNLKRGRGVTALMDAAFRGHTLLVRALLEAGANPAIVSETGVSAIELAKKKRRVEIKALLEQSILQQELKEMQDIPHTAEPLSEELSPEEEEPGEAAEEDQAQEDSSANAGEADTAEVKMPELISCLKCDNEIGLEDLTCPHCGVPILRRYCGRCSRLIPDHLQVCPFCKTSDGRNFRYRPNVEGAVITGIVAIALGVWILSKSWAPNAPSVQNTEYANNILVQSEIAGELAPALRPAFIKKKPAQTIIDTPRPAPSALYAVPPTDHSGQRADTADQIARTTFKSKSPEPEVSRGRRLNAIGYALMKQGRYEEAVKVLSQAVKSFPGGRRDLHYAYALYNLGRSLRLAGHPDSAIPFLEERMKFKDQLDVVQRELIAARRDAGDASAWGVQYE